MDSVLAPLFTSRFDLSFTVIEGVPPRFYILSSYLTQILSQISPQQSIDKDCPPDQALLNDSADQQRLPVYAYTSDT